MPDEPLTSEKKRKHRSRRHTHIGHINHTASRWALLPVLAVVWMAPFLGGSVDIWAMATLYCLLAVLFIVYPVAAGIKIRYRLFLIALLILPLLAFLPVSLTGIPDWRNDLTQRLAIHFPSTISPQPWLTVDSYLAWLGGVAWIYWLSGQGWTREVRKPLAELFAVGMILLTVAGLIGFYTARPLPFWHAQRLFGPFPNRNQTADLLSLTFVLLVALLHMAVAKKSRIAPLWIGGLLIVGYGLIINFSRAGIILPALGVGIYWLITTLTVPSRKKIWIGLASLLLILALLLAFGGETLERLTQGDNHQAMTDDFRRLIFRDTFAMTLQHPWIGLGLSDFRYVFPLFRKLAVVDNGIIHPESDWLWLASEIGWPGTLLILAGSLWLVWRAFCASFKRPHPLRLAAAICGGLFVLHGFFDVSGHRFGTFFPATFLFCLAWPGQLTARPISPNRSYAIALGLVLIAVGWFLNLESPPLWPGHAALTQIKKSAAQQIAQQDSADAFAITDSALRWAPLDWQLYYQRGTSRILLRREWAASFQDFQRANSLERSSPIMPENEGLAWLSYRPELAALPWAEALQRMPPEQSDRAYARYLDLAAPYPRLRSQLEALASNDVSRIIIQLNHVDQTRFRKLLADFLVKNPTLEHLKPANQRGLLDVWVGRGNPAEAIAFIEKNPYLLPTCNLSLAAAYARQNRFELACELAFKTLTPPQLPKLSTAASEPELQREFYARGSLATGVSLLQSQLRRDDRYGALITLERLQTFKGAPLYLHYFEARLQTQNGNWDKAWSILDDYIFRARL